MEKGGPLQGSALLEVYLITSYRRPGAVLSLLDQTVKSTTL